MAENKMLRPDNLLYLEQAALGSFTSLGVLIATTSVNNHTTLTPFNNTGNGLGGKVLMIQTDASCYINVGSANTVAAVASATSASLFIPASYIGIPLLLTMKSGDGFLACISVAGTTNLKVWEMA